MAQFVCQKLKLLSVATTITPSNFGDLKQLKQLLLNLSVETWRICVIMPIGRAEKKKLLLSSTKLKELFEFVSSNKDKIKIQIGENLPFLADYETKI